MKLASRQSPKVLRTGVVTLELLLALPILVIFLLAIIEFGLLLAQLKHVEFASREGARVAARRATPLSAADANFIKARVDVVLAQAGIGPSCGVELNETVSSGMATAFDATITTTCNCNVPTVPTQLPAQPTGAVRVTVCIELNKLAPNVLATFGFDLTGRLISKTTTWPYISP